MSNIIKVEKIGTVIKFWYTYEENIYLNHTKLIAGFNFKNNNGYMYNLGSKNNILESSKEFKTIKGLIKSILRVYSQIENIWFSGVDVNNKIIMEAKKEAEEINEIVTTEELNNEASAIEIIEEDNSVESKEITTENKIYNVAGCIFNDYNEAVQYCNNNDWLPKLMIKEEINTNNNINIKLNLQDNLSYKLIKKIDDIIVLAGQQTYINYESIEVTKVMQVIIYNTKKIIYKTGNNLRLDLNILNSHVDDLILIINNYSEFNYNNFLDKFFIDCNYSRIKRFANNKRLELKEIEEKKEVDILTKDKIKLENKLKETLNKNDILLINNGYNLILMQGFTKKQDNKTFSNLVNEYIKEGKAIKEILKIYNCSNATTINSINKDINILNEIIKEYTS